MSTTPVRWLLLDVGGVLELVDDDAWPQRFRRRWAQRLGLEEAAFAARITAADLPDSSLRSGVADRFWSAYGAAVGASPDVLAAMRADFWDEYCGTGNEELLGALRSLVGTVGLAILSNSGDGAREEEERRFGFSAVFDPIRYSHETGIAKPDPEAFRATLDALEAEPDQVLFIDDRIENVEAAERIGLRAHLHTANATTLAAIRAALV
jgi:FMN phosphatase YigB (HAD superfamily)